MCEGQPDNANRNHRNTRRRRSRPILRPGSGDGDESSTQHFDAIDSSPAIPRTPQHLVTLVARNPSTYVWSAPPIIWKEKYIIAPTLSGHILLWDLTKALRSNVADVDDQINEDGEGEDRVKGSGLHDVAREADVSAFEIHTSHTPDLVLNTHQDEKGEAESASTLGDGAAIAQICIGSPAVLGNGNDVLVAVSVAGFAHIFNLSDDYNPLMGSVAASFQPEKLACNVLQRRAWVQSLLDTVSVDWSLGSWRLASRQEKVFASAPEIRSVMQLQHLPPKTSTENETPNDSDEFLIATIQEEQMISTVGMVEVLNVTAIANGYQELLQHDENATQVQLDEFSLLARPGMEVIDPTTSLLEPSTDLHFKNRAWVPIGGTDSLVRIELSLEDDSMLACVAILAEGSMLFITTNMVDGEFEWCIRATHDQFLLSFPAIGAGCSLQTSGEDVLPNVVCCLRGGTSYLIPCISADKGEQSDVIHTMTYPNDIDTDNPPHRVDYFSAGVLHYSADDRKFTKSSIPIMVYCWSGGIIDVYSSELLQEKKTYWNALFAELLSNGTAALLREHLLSLNAETLALREEVWRLACEEVNKMKSSEPILLSDLVSTRLRAFRSILISI